MPVKLERKLKRQAAKDPSIEDKDAYVYGTLRKTGWKPKRERKKQLSAVLDSIIQFQMPHYPITSMLRRVPDPLQTYHSAGTGAAQAYAAAKSAHDIRRAYVGPFQSISGNATAPAIKGKTARRIGIGAGTFGSGLGVGWWLGKKHEENKRNRELSAKLDSIIQFDIGGWRVRKTADLVGPGGRVTGNEYKSEPAPGFGSAVKRNIGKVALPAVGAVAGAALGHAGWGRARAATTKMRLAGLFEEGEHVTVPSIETTARPASMTPALIGAGAGGLAFLPAGIQADRVRQHQAVLSQLLPMAREDYMREHGIRRRPVEMSAKEEPIEFGIGEAFGKLWGKTKWGKAQAWEKEYKAWNASRLSKGVQPHREGYLTAGGGNYIRDPGAGPLKQSGWNREFTRKSMFSNPGDSIRFGIKEDVAAAMERVGSMRRTLGLPQGGVPKGYSSWEAYVAKPRDAAWNPEFKNKPFVGGSSRRYDPSQSHASWFSSGTKPIRFNSGIPTDDSTATIMQPFQGATTHESKIDQLEFPAGLSPLAALQFPLPVLMRYLNQRNYLQQQFSWKQERLIQLNAKLDEIHASAHPIQ